MTETSEPRKKIVAARRLGPIAVAIHGISKQATRVPPFASGPPAEAMRCAAAIGVPPAVSLETISVGAQYVHDHRPKMMHAIMPAADHVVRAWRPRNSDPAPGATTLALTPSRHAFGSGTS